jgi:beta-glucanase (GH16 family)
MTRRTGALALLCLALATSACTQTSDAKSFPPTKPFSDDFDGPTLGPSWLAINRHGDYSSNSLECYTPGNVMFVDGKLVVTTKVESQTCGDAKHAAAAANYTSAMVQWKSMSFRYGTLEVRAKFPNGQGAWPAIWLLGADCQTSNVTTADNVGTCNWPAAGSDEIDFVEILNNNVTGINQQIHSAGNDDGCVASTSDVSGDFHVYTLGWQPGVLTWQIDGKETCKLTKHVPQRPMFLIINTAVGGVGGGTVSDSALPQQLSVDYVRLTP